jgi:hypothetical protein
MVGERGAGRLPGPGSQVAGGGRSGLDGGFVTARPGPAGQVSAGPHARRQQPPAEYGQVGGLEQDEDLLDLVQGVAGTPVPQSQFGGPLRRLAGKVDVAAVARDGIDHPSPPGRGVDITAQQVDLVAAW